MSLLTNDGHAFIFQGVGLEYRNYLHTLQENHREILEDYCKRCCETVGIDLIGILDQESQAICNRDFVDLIAIYTINCAVYEIYQRYGIKPKMFLGYSMGLYTALVCGGAITFEQGLQLLAKLYESLEYENKKFKGGMAVIIGLTYNDVKKIIKDICVEDKVEIASENNNNCVVISGHKEGIEKVMKAADNEGALKTKEIEVLFPYHSRFVENGSAAYVRFAEKFHINDSSIPIVSSFDQNIIKSRGEIMKEIKRSLTGKMFWKRSIEKAAETGVKSFVEVGLGNSLSKLSKLINVNYKFSTFDKITGR